MKPKEFLRTRGERPRRPLYKRAGTRSSVALLIVMVAALAIWLRGPTGPSENSWGERRIAAASGFGEAQPSPSPEPSEQPVVVPDPVRIQVVDPPSLRKRSAPAPTTNTAPQQNPPRFADSKWFEIAGCERIPFLTHLELVAATPVTSAYEGTKATLRCSVMPINKIDEEVALELTRSPVPGRLQPATVRPGQDGMMVPQPPGGGAPQLFLGKMVHTTLTLDTERLPPGEYDFEITGRSAGTHSSRTMTLTILSNIPPPSPAPAPPPPLPVPEDLPPLPVAPTPAP